VVCVCDGFDKIPESFKKYATEKGFFDEKILQDEGFMEKDKRDDKWRMKTMEELMDENVKKEDIPKNCLHLFQVCTSDFGLEKEYLGGRRINMIFALK
jgi:chitin synthase